MASITTAFGAYLCCTGPILLSLFGATSLGVFSFLESIRPYAIVNNIRNFRIYLFESIQKR